MASRPQRKKRYLAQQADKQKELQQPSAEEYHAAIQDAVRKELPQIIQSVSVREQSVHIGPLPPADEARKYQELLPDFIDRMMSITEGLQKADIEITKREQSFRAIHSTFALSIAGVIVFAALFWAYKMQMAGHGV